MDGRAARAALCVWLAASVRAAADWPQWLGPNRDGIAAERAAGPLLSDPRPVWTASVGLGPSSIVVSGGRAYAMGHRRGEGGRGTDTVFCLDAATGAIRWTHAYDCLSCQSQDVKFYGPRSTPTVDGERGYTLSLEGHLFCFDAATGKVVWSRHIVRDLGGRIPVYGYWTSPLVEGDLLLLELNAVDAACCAFDKRSGEVAWRGGNYDVTCGSPVPTTIDGIRQVIFGGSGSVVALDPATGRELWRHRTFGHGWMAPFVSGRDVFISNASLPRGCGLVRIEGGRPRLLWSDPKKFQTLHSNSIIWEGHIFGIDNAGTDYQGSDSKRSSLACIDVETGEVRWRQPRMGWANLILFDGKLVIQRQDGEIVVAEATPAAYREILRAQVIGGRSWTVPALSDGRLSCRNNDGEIACIQLVGAPAGGSAPEGKAGPGGVEWPRFRGPGGSGRAPSDGIPRAWDLETGAGVLWVVPVPTPGESSPIVAGRRIFLTGARDGRREVACVDLDRGELLWRTEVRARRGSEPPEGRGGERYLAAATPAVDGERICAIFGTGELASLDLDGRIVWTRDLGIPDNDYGHASSLEIWRELLIVQLDQGKAKEGKSRLFGIDGRTGRTVWEAVRPVPASWSTPIAFRAAGRDQVVACGDPWVIAYDPASGEELWRASVLGGEVVPSPIHVGGLVIAASVDGAVAAIRVDGTGDVTATHVVWREEEDLPGIPSPASDGELVFSIDTAGRAACIDAKDGKRLWTEELGRPVQASPTIVGDLLYIVTEEGEVAIFRCARTPERAGRASLGERCVATPAFAHGRMIVRGERRLFCLGGARWGGARGRRGGDRRNPPSAITSWAGTRRGCRRSRTGRSSGPSRMGPPFS